MATIHHTCDDCGSEFTIKYNEEVCETDPLHCPFCASYLLEAEEYDDEDD
jgi:DNA-directed RNA polymerase subunit RPC12/RpoP